MIDMNELKFNQVGLISAIVQDYVTKEVLMVAWMNEESLRITLAEKRTCFWSRSRQTLWRKGETSGNIQKVISIMADCDLDSLLINVLQTRSACHTGAKSCFFNPIYGQESFADFSLPKLYSLIEDRKVNKKEGSYTTYLFEKGEDKILKKVGEESTEVVIAAKNDDQEEMICEISDLIYHTLVLMVQKGISIEDIKRELAKRHVIDQKVKQENMGKMIK